MVGVSVVGATINILFGIILTPRMGVWGVCIASVLCYFSQTIYKFVDVRKFCKIEYNWKTVIPSIVVLTIQVVIMSLEIEGKLVVAFALTVLLILINVKALLSAATQLLARKG